MIFNSLECHSHVISKVNIQSNRTDVLGFPLCFMVPQSDFFGSQTTRLCNFQVQPLNL